MVQKWGDGLMLAPRDHAIGHGVLTRRRPATSAATLFTLFALCARPLCARIVNASANSNNVRAILPLEAFGMGTAVYSNQFANSQLNDRLNEAGVTTLRYSGGGYADVYYWSVHKDSPLGGTTTVGYVAPGMPTATPACTERPLFRLSFLVETRSKERTS